MASVSSYRSHIAIELEGVTKVTKVANVTVRNIDDSVIASLKAQAKANHRSLEDEIRHVLAQQALRHTRLDRFRERTAHLASLTADVPQADSAILLRDDRDR